MLYWQSQYTSFPVFFTAHHGASPKARLGEVPNPVAAAGATARERTGSTHIQPTPHSIAAAEGKLGEVSAQQIEAVREAMVRARAADSAGDKGACEQALVDAERALKP